LAGETIAPDRILAAMFGQTAPRHSVERAEKTSPRENAAAAARAPLPDTVSTWEGVFGPRAEKPFTLRSPAFSEGGVIPGQYAEADSVSPPLEWENAPQGARSFALAVTDPDLPPEFNFPRAFAHWMILNIPAGATGLPEGASPGGALPDGVSELPNDFVTFRIPGYARGYGGPWPPDAPHRYIFTLYALKSDRLAISDVADYVEFVRLVLPATITTATLVGVYGPASTPLPSAA
jgi:Raf kinase inhibitor-like YbhB/YbcL family protein